MLVTVVLKRRRSRKRPEKNEASGSYAAGCRSLALAPLAACEAAETIRVAVQKTGTFAWELAVIRAHGLDKQADLAH